MCRGGRGGGFGSLKRKNFSTEDFLNGKIALTTAVLYSLVFALGVTGKAAAGRNTCSGAFQRLSISTPIGRFNGSLHLLSHWAVLLRYTNIPLWVLF